MGDDFLLLRGEFGALFQRLKDDEKLEAVSILSSDEPMESQKAIVNFFVESVKNRGFSKKKVKILCEHIMRGVKCQ
jgi:predicted Ser/Thr protein kinase